MPVNTRPAAIADVLILEPEAFGDGRGWFAETWSRRDWAAAGVDSDFVQDNHAATKREGVLRGLHFQIPPHEQGKLVRVVRGAILDVAVDVRKDSPTYGRHVAIDLSAADRRQVWIPPGFAHGYLTREPDTEVLYKCTAYYAPESERGVLWRDPALNIEWGRPPDSIIVNDRDDKFPALADLPADFGAAP